MDKRVREREILEQKLRNLRDNNTKTPKTFIIGILAL